MAVLIFIYWVLAGISLLGMIGGVIEDIFVRHTFRPLDILLATIWAFIPVINLIPALVTVYWFSYIFD